MLRFILMTCLIGLVLPADVSAQRRGGDRGGQGWNGNGSRGNGSWSNTQGNWNNNGNRRYYGNGGYYGGYSGYGYGFGLGGLYGGYNNLGGVYGGYNSYPYGSTYNSYDLSGYSTYPGVRDSAYYDPTTANLYNTQNITAANNASRARVEVVLPDASAELLIQGQRMDLTGRNRVFISPELTPGKMFIYTITMRRVTNGQNADDTRTVEVQASSNSTLDFTKSAVMQMPKPASDRDELLSPLPK